MSDPEYSPRPFIRLVEKYADSSGNVNYAAWQASSADLEILQQQVAMLARISPYNRPELFAEKSAVRAYWINTYNTLVLQAVLELWPLASVRDVKNSLTSRLIPGKGFFYDREVVVGGQKTNLLKLENNIIRKQVPDPRLHFALNCASDSCPALRPSNWTEDELDEAAREFINQPANVTVEAGKVRLSRIFKWFRKDFPDDLYAYLQTYAGAGLREQLKTAIEQKYGREYFDYNWDINITTLQQQNCPGGER